MSNAITMKESSAILGAIATLGLRVLDSLAEWEASVSMTRMTVNHCEIVYPFRAVINGHSVNGEISVYDICGDDGCSRIVVEIGSVTGASDAGDAAEAMRNCLARMSEIGGDL